MIVELKNSKEFDQILTNNKKVIVDCFAVWCGPCKMMGPELEKVVNTNKDWILVKVDIDQHSEIAQKFAIQAVPTIIYIVDKQLKETTVGYKPASEIQKIIGKY